MNQYVILFYKRKKDSISTAKYYREFPSFDDLIAWCKAIANECRYSHYKHKTISVKEFLKHID